MRGSCWKHGMLQTSPARHGRSTSRSDHTERPGSSACRRAQTPVFPVAGQPCPRRVPSRSAATDLPLIHANKWTARDERHHQVSIKLAFDKRHMVLPSYQLTRRRYRSARMPVCIRDDAGDVRCRPARPSATACKVLRNAKLSSAAATLEYFQMRLEDVEARMISRVGDQCD